MVGSSFNPRPKSINEVVDYVLKRLGVQLLEINVTEEQILDRISDAVTYFQEHHADGTFEGYFKTKITPTTLVISSRISSSSMSPSASTSPSSSSSPSASASISPSRSVSPSSSRSASNSPSPSGSPSSSVSPSASVSPSHSVSPSVSPSDSSSRSPSISPSASVSPSHSVSPSASVSASPENRIEAGDCITAATWTATIYSVSQDQATLEIHNFQPTSPDSVIADGQTLQINGYDFIIESFVLGTPELGYVTIPSNVESILSVAQLPSFDLRTPGVYDPFKTWTNQIFHYKGSGLAVSFYLQDVRNDTLSQLNALHPWADFNRYMNRAYLNSYDYNKNIGQWLVLRVITAVDPEEYPEMYGDTWFLRYCVELLRRQWGENLEKFDEVALLNGVKVNGTKMRELADVRIKELEEEMFSTYRMPDDFFLA